MAPRLDASPAPQLPPAGKQPDWIGRIILVSLVGGIALATLGALLDITQITFAGAVLMVPVLVGIPLAIAALAAEKAEGMAARFVGNGPLAKAVFWAVFLLVAALFLWGGTSEFPGPRFWGSID